MLIAAFLPARANPVTYHLSGVAFADGATASGSFVFHIDTQIGSSWSVSTSAGNLPSFTFNDANSLFFYTAGPAPFNIWLFTDTGDRYMFLGFLDPLDGEGEFALYIGNSWECNNCKSMRYVTAGTLTSLDANAVPEPGTSILMLSGFGALGFMLRRRKQAAA
jgi:hypothetical protein